MKIRRHQQSRYSAHQLEKIPYSQRINCLLTGLEINQLGQESGLTQLELHLGPQGIIPAAQAGQWKPQTRPEMRMTLSSLVP
jgi:hypothetical protein